MGASVELQAREEIADGWRPIASYGSRSSGQGHTPSFKLGVQKLRLVVLRGPRIFAASARSVRVFGEVSLAKLLNRGQDDPGTYSAPTFTYPYVYGVSRDGNWGGVLSDTDNQCRQVTITGVLSDHSFASQQMTLVIVQQSANPTSASGPQDQIISDSAIVKVGQSWSLNVLNDGQDNTFYLNGHADCFGTKHISIGQ